MTDIEGYEKYVREHISAVQQMGDYLGVSPAQIQIHDLSKWSDEEYLPYANYFYGDESVKNKDVFNRAWLHHIHNNPHHWQHWLLGDKVFEMPRRFAIEMICDWVGMAITRTGDMTDWLISSSNEISLHPNTALFVENILRKECSDWVDMTNFTGWKQA